MNYFAHGRNHLHSAYLLAGTAVPDWLSVVDRRVRARRRLARRWLDAPESHVADVARGILHHLHDDAWFHQTRAFAELSLDFAVAIREQLPGDTGFRPSFLGHILVEILLDAVLIESDPPQLDAYYAVMASLDPPLVAEAVDRMTTKRAEQLPEMIRRFCSERFLYDYQDDAKLLTRLNRVMRRVRLPQLPSTMLTFFPAARQLVRQRRSELLNGETNPTFEELN